MLTVVNGAMDGIARALGEIVSLGDRVALESPGFPPFFDLVDSLGRRGRADAGRRRGRPVPTPCRRALAVRPVAIVLQPRAQNPTGAAMTRRRADALARILRAADAVPWILEDDHSGAISTSLDVSLGAGFPDRVVHVRSFSKSHGPDLRIAAIGGPASLMDPLVARRMLGPGWTSRMLQTILHDLLTADQSTREVAAAARRYADRQLALVARPARGGRRAVGPRRDQPVAAGP